MQILKLVDQQLRTTIMNRQTPWEVYDHVTREDLAAMMNTKTKSRRDKSAANLNKHNARSMARLARDRRAQGPPPCACAFPADLGRNLQSHDPIDHE